MRPIDLRDIVTEEFQLEIQDAFAFATGFGVVFVDREGRHIGPGSNFCRFCTAINKTYEGACSCAMSNRNAIEIALETRKPSIYVCHAGLINIEIPLIYEGCYVGAITAGQVLCTEMDYYPTDLVYSKTNWLDSPELAEYYKEIKVLTRQQIEATTTALANICNYILQTVTYGKIQQAFAANREQLLLYEKRQIELEHQLKLAQLDALQKQVTPHFIFNVINSISRLISMGEYDTTKTMLDAFAGMLRYSLTDVQSTVSLGQELDYIERYLAIQKIRFGDRIEYRLDCDATLRELRIPYFCLQPLVENSIEHGLLTTPAGGSLSLCCRRDEDGISIELTDNGVGIEADMLRVIQDSLLTTKGEKPEKHIGLYNCYNRLMLLFGKRLRFQLESAPGKGTRILIKIMAGDAAAPA